MSECERETERGSERWSHIKIEKNGEKSERRKGQRARVEERARVEK